MVTFQASQGLSTDGGLDDMREESFEDEDQAPFGDNASDQIATGMVKSVAVAEAIKEVQLL
jgi:hypothetical protein